MPQHPPLDAWDKYRSPYGQIPIAKIWKINQNLCRSMHLFWMEKKKKKFHWLNRSSLLVGSTLIVNRPNLPDRTESDVSKSVTSVTLCSCGETSAGERECVKHFQSKSLRSSHRGRGGGAFYPEPQAGYGSGRGGEIGRIAHMHPPTLTDTHSHQALSFFPPVSLSPSPPLGPTSRSQTAAWTSSWFHPAEREKEQSGNNDAINKPCAVACIAYVQ